MTYNIDKILSNDLINERLNMQIYLVCHNLTQADLVELMGYSKSFVSKSLTSDDKLSSNFINKFCSTFNIDYRVLDSEPIIAYYYFYNEKRKQEISATGNDPGSLIDKYLLKKYLFKEKYNSQNNLKIVPVKVEDNSGELTELKVEQTLPNDTMIPLTNNLVSESIDKNYIYTRIKIPKKSTFTKIPLYIKLISIYFIVAFVIIGIFNKDLASFALSVIVFPISWFANWFLSKANNEFFVADVNSLSYEIDEDKVKIKSMKITYIIGAFFELSFLGIAVYSLIKLGNLPISIIIFLVISLFSTLITIRLCLISKNIYPKRITNDTFWKIKFSEELLTVQIIIFVVLLAYCLLEITGGIVIIFRVIILLINIFGFILNKNNLNKYKLYQFKNGIKTPYLEIKEPLFGRF